MEENRVLLNWMGNCTSTDLIQLTQCKGKLTTSDLLTKMETTREPRSSVPALQAESVMVNGPVLLHKTVPGCNIERTNRN